MIETSENAPPPEILKRDLDAERYELLTQIEDRLETPLLILGLAWLILLVIEFVRGSTPVLNVLTDIIWVIFLIDFAIKVVLAPDKTAYLKNHWLTVISLAVPALRIFRIARVVSLLRVARTVRGLRLLRLVGSLNRGMRALSATMGRRGFIYVILFTLIVTFAGAAGIYTFESDDAPQAMTSYWDALWWTAMLMTTLGSEYWPQSGEGRVLCLLLSLYAFTVFGYVTATLATFFIGRDAENEETELAGSDELKVLLGEVRALREEVRDLRQTNET